MAHHHPTGPHRVIADDGGDQHGSWLGTLRTAVRRWAARPAARQPVPQDLLVDVLADRGLRIRGQQEEGSRISGPWF